MTGETRNEKVERKRLEKEERRKLREEYDAWHKKLDDEAEALKTNDFTESINKTVNLLTCFGIFNALVIYSGTIDVAEISATLAFVFSILSIIILNEAYKFYEKFSKSSTLMIVFSFSLLIIQLTMGCYLAVKFPLGAQIVIGIICTMVFERVERWLLRAILSFVKSKEQMRLVREKSRWISFIHVFAYIIFFFIAIIYIAPVIYDFFVGGGLERLGHIDKNYIPSKTDSLAPNKNIYELWDSMTKPKTDSFYWKDRN